VKLRIRNKLVDDIDYFTFPLRYLEKSNINKNEAEFHIERKRYLEQKTVMVRQILWYAQQIKSGACDFPKALNLL
jgi:hypothetical protein